jgi:small-conductance mechanosensitive channel
LACQREPTYKMGTGLPMNKRQKTAAVVLVLLLAGAAYGLFRTNEPRLLSNTDSTDSSSNIQSSYVDQTPLQTAQRLALLASGEDEQPLAKEALRLADHEVDLAFATALRNAAQHPPTLNAEARERQAVLSEAESALERDKAEVARLTEAESKAEGEKKVSANDELEIAKAQLELDADEVEDAKQDLMRSGGDPQGRIQAMVQEHEAVLHDTPAPGAGANADVAHKAGLVHRVQQWISLRQGLGRLRQAQADAAAAAVALSGKHDVLIALVGEKKAGNIQQLEKTDLGAEPPAYTAASTGHPIAGRAAAATKTKPVVRSHEQAAVVVKVTKERSAQQNELATYDKRVETYKDLAAVYDKWSTLVAAKQRSTLRRAIWGFTIILFILLVAIFFSTWMERLLGRLPLARRQVDTLRAVTRLSLQIFAVLLTLLVIFGPPGQLGTFLGLAGAGLTVALKDFIVSFVGWFVLMGRNGIRLGDWVEINGVSGEVVELGMFHTVLLETGNWTDSGHPTGRRVTFTNSFAIEGHYFNFSTSGQWMWDELQIVLPAGKDPFPIVNAIQKKVVEATAESTGLAEKEWQRAARSRDMSALSAAPAINVRPVIGGVELGVRYITRANERYQLRGKLYGVAMDLLAAKDVSRAASVDTGATVRITDDRQVDKAPTPTEVASTKS